MTWLIWLFFSHDMADFFLQDRKIVVRSSDGTLRAANWGERDRINQIYNPAYGRQLFPPKMFESEQLEASILMKTFTYHSNALANIHVMPYLIGWCQKFVTVSEIWCHYGTSFFIGLGLVLRRWHRLNLVNNKCFEKKKVKMCIRMGITLLKIVIWGGNSLVLWSP